MNSTLVIDSHLLLRLPVINDEQEIFQLLDSNRDRLGPRQRDMSKDELLIDSLGFIEYCIKGFQNSGAHSYMLQFEDQIVGFIGFVSLDIGCNNKAELSYWIGSEFEGKGLVYLSTQSLIQYCFKDLKLNRLFLQIEFDNFRSIKLAEKLGFKLEGTLRQNIKEFGRFIDMNIYGLLAKETK